MTVHWQIRGKFSWRLIPVFRYVTPCSSVDTQQRIGGPCCLNLQGKTLSASLTQKMEIKGQSEVVAPIH